MVTLLQFDAQRCRKFLPFLFRAYSNKINEYSKKRPLPPALPWPGAPSAERGMEMIWLTRELAHVLRHGAKSAGLAIRADGYVSVDELLKHHSLRGLNFAKLDTIVSRDPKQRFRLIVGRSGRWLIRANEGHSIPGIMAGMTHIRWAWQVPLAVHGTSMKAWKAISKRGISRMRRPHIHLAQDLTGDATSGSEVLIFIDLTRALKAGLRFFRASNGVILTTGNERGFLEPRFFSRVESNGGAPLVPEWKAEGEGTAAAHEGIVDVALRVVPEHVVSSSIPDNIY
ncbi:KptA family-domain-containing protein [Mycena haematopus]|nr:KptA family-domain-containing protein [Mycena haematopus]